MKFGVRTKFFFLRHYWWLLTLALALAIVWMVRYDQPIEIAFPLIGSLLSLFYFIQKQKLEELRLFREIFKECNSRYDALNEKLAEIRESSETELTTKEKQTLIDYFNLCGEEYLYFSHGFIDPSVWKAWENGMTAIVKSPRISPFWQQEKATESYYGLPL